MLPPAHELLTSPMAMRPAWARFDATWYLQTYPQAREHCRDAPDEALAFYLAEGAGLGHSPSPLFDETYYLAANPDIATLVSAGDYRSGFDHFCRHGHRTASPHWLFDDALYGRLYEDMSLENLDLHGCAGRYDHYLKSGQHEFRQAHFLFDGAYYRKQAIAAGATDAQLAESGAFVHFLYSLNTGRRELPPSIYFDPAWYGLANIGVSEAMASGRFGSAIAHYLCNDSPRLFDPVAEFSEAYYCETNTDINYAVEMGQFRSGYQHFVQFGAFELRRPHPQVDLVYYRNAHARVRDDLNTGLARDAFAHLRQVGIAEGLAYYVPDSNIEITEAAAKALFTLKARQSMPIFARRVIDFTCLAPELSVIMVVFNKVELTLQALASLRGNHGGPIELILVDNGSTDETRWIDEHVHGAVIIHLDENLGFLRAANRALAKATAPALLFLNNDVELGFGAIAAALARLASAPDIGAVGGKVIRSHGKLQEAGCIIWQDGTATGYLRDQSPLIAEANFVRQVDFCSGVFLLCRTQVISELGGFDEAFSPAYYEDVDLCVRLQLAGYKTIYDPAVVIHHLEFGSAGSSDVSNALMRRGLRIFQAKHAGYLAAKQPHAPGQVVHARCAGPRRRHVLYIDDTVPVRRLGSGFVRANDVVQAILKAGYAVTIFPVNGVDLPVARIIGDFPDDVEILYDRNIMSLAAFLSERAQFYDAVWVSRTHNLARVLPALTDAGLASGKAALILDTEAIDAIRQAARQVVLEAPTEFDFHAALTAEFAAVAPCRQITAVNRFEADLLASLGLANVSVLGTVREPTPMPAGFGDRHGLLFVASIHQADSPNLDSLFWYRDEILPALREQMADVPVLNVVGYSSAAVDLSEFRHHPDIRLHGPVADLTPFYQANRVFIAPTRFAAGTPYKIYEAASYGLPCVVTDLLARQLEWQAGVDLLTAPARDARFFAAQIAVLYRTEPIWQKLRAGALAQLKLGNNREGFEAEVAKILKNARLVSNN